MVTLENVKDRLRIDFQDMDADLSWLLSQATRRASTMMGVSTDSPEFDTPEVDGAILDDIATMFQHEGDMDVISNDSLATYRRLSRKPMF